MLGAAFIIGMASAISSIMKSGNIIDTVVHALAGGLNMVPAVLQAPANADCQYGYQRIPYIR